MRECVRECVRESERECVGELVGVELFFNYIIIEHKKVNMVNLTI